jgi:hypothetical protein
MGMSADARRTGSRRDAVAAWLALTAPGALVTCAIISLALLLIPELTPRVIVPPAVRYAAAGLLLVHAALTGVLVLKPGQWLVALLFLFLLATDAGLCGVLLNGPEHRLALLVAVAVLVMSLEVGGWLAAALTVAATAVGTGVAAVWGISSALVVPIAVAFPTTLAVETSFAGHAVVAAPAVSFATRLSVDTSRAGVPALTFPTVLSVETWVAGGPAFASPEGLFIPGLALVLVALCLGLATSLWRVRKARTAVAASIVAAARVTT